MTPAELELLATVDIATPCSKQWKDLTGDERKRFCAACRQHVYNLGELTVADVVALMARAREERVCLRFFRRLDGTVMTKDCEPAMVIARRIVTRHVSKSGSPWLTALGAMCLVGVVAMGVWAWDAYARRQRRLEAMGGPSEVSTHTKTFSTLPMAPKRPVQQTLKLN